MGIPQLLVSYFVWHYTRAYKQIFVVWKNYTRYVMQMFSIVLLLRTLFAPWKRMVDVYQGGFHPEAFFAGLLINTLSRFVGLVIRVPLIILGVLLSALLCVALILFYIYWTLFPVILVVIISLGIHFLYV